MSQVPAVTETQLEQYENDVEMFGDELVAEGCMAPPQLPVMCTSYVLTVPHSYASMVPSGCLPTKGWRQHTS